MLSAAHRRRPPAQIVAQVSEVGARVEGVLAGAVDAWRGVMGSRGPEMRSQESSIRADYGALDEKLSQFMTPAADTADLPVVSRHLERILRHAVWVADQAAGVESLSSKEFLSSEAGGGS